MSSNAMYNTRELSTIKDYMLARNHTLAVAESVTSGHLQAAFSLAADASGFFHGGITVYNLGQKARHLHINPIHAEACNSVSQIIADEMALNTLSLFSSDWAIGITGYASPLPDLGIRDLFAFYAIAFRRDIALRGKVTADDHGLYNVQVFFANEVLKALSQHLGNLP